jgi:hypothetical protein
LLSGGNERVHCNDDADPGEFDQYSNFVNSGLWSTRDEKGSVNRITDAPLLFLSEERSPGAPIDAGACCDPKKPSAPQEAAHQGGE